MVIDLVMIILMLILMASLLTGDTAHEVLGVSFGILFIAHNILNWRWYRALPKGRYDAVRILQAAVNLLLLLDMLAVMVSAMTISQTVFASLDLKGGVNGRKIHMFTAYLGFILMSIHLGLHWKMIMSMVRKLKKSIAANRVLTFVLRMAAALIAAYGVYASFGRNMSSKFTFQNTFDFWDYNKSAELFFIDYLAIMGLYVFVTHYILKLFRKRKNKLTDESRLVWRMEACYRKSKQLRYHFKHKKL